MSALKPIAGKARAEADHQLETPRSNYPLQPLTVRIREACRISGIGRSKLYQLIKSREIAIIKVGAITLIPMESLKAYLGVDFCKPS